MQNEALQICRQRHPPRKQAHHSLGGGAYQFLCIFGDFLWSLDIQTVGLARGFTIVLCIHRRSNIATSNHSTVYTSL